LSEEAEPISIPELAKRSGLSSSRLSKLFHDQTGVTLVEYRQRQAIQKFLRLYARGRRRTILQAALEAGFGSYAQFHKVFKRVIGIGPAEYRRKIAVEPPALSIPTSPAKRTR
jgi:AraC-like DNA-binding protein